MKLIKFITGICSIIILLHSCKPFQTIRQHSAIPVPATFDGSPDTTNAADINWKDFFSDKNLISLIDTALANNWDIQMAFQRIHAAQSDVLVARGALKPTADGVLATGLRKFGLYTMDGAGNITTEIQNGKIVPEHLPDYFIGLQTAWEVDLWGKLKNQKKAAVARLLSSVEGRNLAVTGLIAEIAVSYYELLALDETLKIIDETIILQENAYEIVKVQKEAAAANELAVKQFEAQLLNVRSFRMQVLQQIAENENRINFFTARFPQPVIRDSSFFNGAPPARIHYGIPSALLQNRPDVRQAALDLEASKADVLSARAAFYPSFNITGGIGFQAFKPGLLLTAPESIAYNLFGSLTAPLVNRAAIKATFNRANAVQLEALYNYQKTIANSYVEVYNELLRINNLRQAYELKARETDALNQSIEISEVLFRTGRASYLEVLFTQQNALQAKLELVETKKAQFFSTVNMYKALGGGWK